jgi:hypothetical protein
MNVNIIQSQNDNTPPPPDHENILISDLDQLTPNVCNNMVLNNTLNYLTLEELTKLLNKIRHGGVISIYSLDITELAKAFYFDNIDIAQLSTLIANQQTQHSLMELKTFFEQQRYNIENASIKDLSFYLKVRRP